MKTTFFFILLALAFAGNTFAQVLLQERTECRLQNPWTPVAVTTTASTATAESPDPTPLLDRGKKISKPQTSALSFELVLTTPAHIDISDTSNTAVEGHINNLTNDKIRIVFHRWQTLPDSDWSSTVCLDICYPSIVDSLPWGSVQYSEIPANGQIPFILHFYPSANSKDSATAYVWLAVVGSTEEDTIGMGFSAQSHQLEAVHRTSAVSGGFKISSVYPSPLVSGSSIKAKVYSPQSTTYSYSIFDAVGREVAYGSTRHRLLIGDNTLEISSLEGLPAGSYLLRVNFQGGGSDAYPFQVIR